MTRQTKIVLAILAGAAAIALAMLMLRSEPEEQDIDAPPPLVETALLQPAAGPLIVQGAGTVEPGRRVEITAEISGKLIYVNPALREGALVDRGTPLFRIDPADFRNRVESARADVAAQSVAVLQAREEVEIAEAELRRFEAREKERSAALSTVDENDYASRICRLANLPPAQRLALLQREPVR